MLTYTLKHVDDALWCAVQQFGLRFTTGQYDSLDHVISRRRIRDLLETRTWEEVLTYARRQFGHKVIDTPKPDKRTSGKQPRKEPATETAVVVNDIHFPFHDPRALALFLYFAKALRPDRIYLNGDIGDFWDISKFIKPLSIQVRLEEEIRMIRSFLGFLRSICPKAKIIYIAGNHEWRLESYIIQKCPELDGLKVLALENLLHFEELGIEWVYDHQRENYTSYGKLLIGHFNKALKHSSYTGKNLLEEKGISLIQAHTHRGGSHYKTGYGGCLVAYENFCLCDLNPKYMQRPNWQLGFSVIQQDRESDHFTVQQLPIIKYGVIYGSRVFRVSEVESKSILDAMNAHSC